MYLQVPLLKYKLCSTYGYLRISINSVTPTGDLDKYKSAISTSICSSLLYEFMQSLVHKYAKNQISLKCANKHQWLYKTKTNTSKKP